VTHETGRTGRGLARAAGAWCEVAAPPKLQIRSPHHPGPRHGSPLGRQFSPLVCNAALWCLDEHCCDHPAQLTEIRFRALVGVNPRDEFHHIALREFQRFFTAAYDHAADIIRTDSVEQPAQGITRSGFAGRY